MSPIRILGIVLVAIGGVLLVFAFGAADSPVEEVSRTLTGRFTEETRWHFILGIAAIVGGVLLAIFGRQRV
jgi:hypothetical protein